MKKASRVLVLLLIAVLVLSVFSGCGLFGKNTEKYRAMTALQVGNEKITIGKLIDTFNTNYNNYASYISQGYIGVDYILDLTVKSLYTQYMKIDDYKSTHEPVSPKGDFANQEYLETWEFDYAVKYIKYILFTTLDGVVEGYIANDYTLMDEETDDTSRDFTKYEDLTSYATYSDYYYKQNFLNEDMDEYFSKYYDGIVTTTVLSVDEYVFADETAASAKVDALNARIEEGEITAKQLIDWQAQALKQYKKNVQNNYNYGVEKLISRQIEDFITSTIVAKYNRDIYQTIDHENFDDTKALLVQNYNALKNNQLASFNLNNNYVTFIEGLSSDSNIYAVPEGYNYIFVKNILIPFSDSQKKLLSNLEKQLGSSSDERYLAARRELAAQIVADDFFSTKDDDGNFATVKDIFAVSGNKLVINTANTELGQYFTADGKVVPMEGKTAADTVVELMKRFNTDTAQHTAKFEYVVRVGEVPESYTAKWVAEFVDAANEAYTLAAGANGGTYALAISTYGVHIVYYTANVTAQTFDFENELMVSSSAAHKMYTNYFTTETSSLLEQAVEALQKVYYTGATEGKKIEKTAEFDKFVKDNGMTYDFAASLKLEDDE